MLRLKNKEILLVGRQGGSAAQWLPGMLVKIEIQSSRVQDLF